MLNLILKIVILCAVVLATRGVISYILELTSANYLRVNDSKYYSLNLTFNINKLNSSMVGLIYAMQHKTELCYTEVHI